jgi:two-component system, chemotaxis family, protein-glutamate methylesterase/glutaminase
VTIEAVVIGASAGAVESLMSILPMLRPSTPFPVIVVVHMPPDRRSMFVELFAGSCRVRVKEAEDKEVLEKGTVYFAAPGYHLLVEPDLYLSLSCDEPVRYSRPSIDVLFQSAADAYGAGLLGIVLSGANDDGAAGLLAVCSKGGRGIVQDPQTALCATMPEAALQACGFAEVMSPEEIGAYLRAQSAEE